MNAEEYIDNLKSPMQEIAKELRSILLAKTPKLKEEIKWNVPTYSINKGLCSIMAHKSHVNLQIFQGANIEGSTKLEGTGKNMRHLKFSKIDEICRIDIEKYLTQAIALDK